MFVSFSREKSGQVLDNVLLGIYNSYSSASLYFMIIFYTPFEFEWDKGNQNKNLKHDVTDAECEEVFFDSRKRILKDVIHSYTEDRFLLIGKTKQGRLLFVVFTMRTHKIRVVSSRDLNKKEKKFI